MFRVNPDHENNIAIEKGQNILYYLVSLKQHGFKINPHDLCIPNKAINGNKCTISFYIYEKKVMWNLR